ncbi:PREDICTED: methionyl-tRNA formyltransferase, mitochondrial isoform X2 [Rhagoletis zephyria]|uniref:methionyl-tRNA formyltransferase, mitochondrial isoform X2 n=1 Tax=Rhagoletis zephyria TaxID=28612 RepID=UPI000811795A|nr:PREDICTED: methionyl-tRNA formyltransferase, mitochondrial isoform X2 [Rhagoletis zephyria]
MICSPKFYLNLFKYRRKINESVSALRKHQRWKCKQAVPSVLTNGKLKVLFFGTDAFSLPSLQALHKSCFDSRSLGIVTSFKNPANCVRTYAEHHRLPLYRWPIVPDICGGYDLGVVVSFGHLIPEKIIRAFPNGMINVHASLLPRWRGAAPIIYAIMNGDAKTGVSIMKIEPKHFDVGDILAQQEVVIQDGILMPELHNQLAIEGANLLVTTIQEFPRYLENTTRQNNDFATFAPKITTTITEVNWTQISAEQLHRRFRALFGYKNLNTIFQNKIVQLIDVQLPLPQKLPDALRNVECGGFYYDRKKRCLLVRCAADSYVEIHQLRIEGKKVMTAQDFNNGFLKQINTTQHYFTTK